METTIVEYLAESCERNAGRTALVDGDRRLTYDELMRRIHACASRLSESGIAKGDKMAFMMPNGADFVILLYALFQIGAVPSPLNCRLFGEELARQITLSQANAVLFAPEFASEGIAVLKKADGIRIAFGIEGDLPGIESSYSYQWVFSGENEGFTQKAPVEPDDPALILFTSGSTGNPKAALKTHRALAEESRMSRLWPGAYGPSDSFLLFNPLFHQGGLSFLFAMLACGGKVVLQRSLRESEVVRSIKQERITQMLLLPPSLCSCIKNYTDASEIDLSSVRCVTLTGGKSAEREARDIFDLFPNAKVRGGYGHTENAAILSNLFSREQFSAKPSLAKSVGLPVDGCRIKLLDKSGKEVPVGEVGEAWALSPAMFSGYFKMGPDGVFFDDGGRVDGWFPTGDLLKQDSDGLYCFAGRSKEMIKTGGENVFSIEVEQVLEDYPGIAEAAVFGVKDDFLGECVAAALVAEPGERIDPAGVVDFCRARIAGYKKPRAIVVLDKLPTTTTGKLDREALTKRFDGAESSSLWKLPCSHKAR